MEEALSGGDGSGPGPGVLPRSVTGPIAASNDYVFVTLTDTGGTGARAAVKDSIDVAGYPTRMGSACLDNAPPAQRHAEAVSGLLAADFRIVGKTNLHELAFGVTGINLRKGTPVNPRAPDRVPGGSSSGSAVAVALGLVELALGTDTGGSIRIPAACCGVYGLKPSYGRVSRGGVHPALSTLDCVGPLARDLHVVERAMAALDPLFRSRPLPRRMTLGWLDVEANPEVKSTVRAALRRADVVLRPIRIPSFIAAFTAGLTIVGVETWRAFGQLAAGPGLGDDVRARLLRARATSAAELDAAEAVRAKLRGEIDEALTQVDALALPTLPDFPLRLDTAMADATAALGSSALVRPFNVSGHPALSLPLPVSGPPVALQLVAPVGGDETLCALGRVIAAAGESRAPT